MAYADGRLKLLSQQRVERATLESEIDSENMNELTNLRNEIAIQTENELRAIGDNFRTTLDDSKLELAYFHTCLS